MNNIPMAKKIQCNENCLMLNQVELPIKIPVSEMQLANRPEWKEHTLLFGWQIKPASFCMNSITYRFNAVTYHNDYDI